MRAYGGEDENGEGGAGKAQLTEEGVGFSYLGVVEAAGVVRLGGWVGVAGQDARTEMGRPRVGATMGRGVSGQRGQTA